MVPVSDIRRRQQKMNPFMNTVPFGKRVALQPLYCSELGLENGQAEVARFISEYTADVNTRNKLRSDSPRHWTRLSMVRMRMGWTRRYNFPFFLTKGRQTKESGLTLTSFSRMDRGFCILFEILGSAVHPKTELASLAINTGMTSFHQGAEDTRSADMLPSTMQEGGPEKRCCSPKIGKDEFEEKVRTFKPIAFLLP